LRLSSSELDTFSGRVVYEDDYRLGKKRAPPRDYRVEESAPRRGSRDQFCLAGGFADGLAAGLGALIGGVNPFMRMYSTICP